MPTFKNSSGAKSVEILYALSFAKHLSPVVYITAVGDVTLKWFDSNGLKMNSNKTQCILFATPNFNKRADVSNNNWQHGKAYIR